MPSPAEGFFRAAALPLLQTYIALAAVEVIIDIICEKSCTEVSVTADAAAASIRIQIFRQYKPYTADDYIMAVRTVMRRYRNGFHPALVFLTHIIQLMKDDCQSNTPMRTDIFQNHIKLKNSSK